MHSVVFVLLCFLFSCKKENIECVDSEIHNEDTGTWTQQSDFPVYLNDITFLLSTENYIYAGRFGTMDPNYRAVYFDQQNETWNYIDTFPNLYYLGINVFVINDKLYAGGGETWGNFYTDYYVFDPLLNSWSPIADCPVGISKATGFSAGGNGYLIGGINNYQNNMDVYKYDPITDTWSINGSVGIFWGEWVNDFEVVGNSVFTYLNNSILEYNVASNTQTEITVNKKESEALHEFIYSDSAAIFIPGYSIPNSTQCHLEYEVIYRFDVVSRSWSIHKKYESQYRTGGFYNQSFLMDDVLHFVIGANKQHWIFEP